MSGNPEQKESLVCCVSGSSALVPSLFKACHAEMGIPTRGPTRFRENGEELGTGAGHRPTGKVGHIEE